jgi:SAM-dependent methyltransferase
LPDNFVDREREVDLVAEFLRSGTHHYRTLVVEGSIGAGKSTLVRWCIDRLEEHRFDQVLWYRIPRTAYDPCREALFWLQQHLGAESEEIARRSDKDKIDAVVEGLERGNTLVVLDGAENIQSMNPERFGEIDHPGVRELLTACRNWTKSRLILTTNLGFGANSDPPVQIMRLDNLAGEVDITPLTERLLKRQKELARDWARSLGNHVGMLRVLVGYLEAAENKAQPPPPVDGDQPVDPKTAFSHLLGDYWAALPPGQQDFLRRLSTRLDGAYEEEWQRVLKTRPSVSVGREMTPQLRRSITRLLDTPLIEVETHPDGRRLIRTNPLCELLFVSKRGKAEGRARRQDVPIVSETTAVGRTWNPLASIPSRREPTPELPAIIDFLRERGCLSIVDYGCGTGRNVPPLCKAFERVWMTDIDAIQGLKAFTQNLPTLSKPDGCAEFRTVERVPYSKLRVDAALLIDVLHTVPDIEMRKTILYKVKACLKKRKRFLVVLTPGPKQSYYRIGHESDVFEDGIMLPHGKSEFTFYKEYDSDELRAFVEDQGYRFLTKLRGDHKYVQVFEALDDAPPQSNNL